MFRNENKIIFVKGRNPVVDMMKGIGLLLVMWGHARNLLPVVIAFISSFHMPLFFILSGYYFKEYSDLLNKKDILISNAKRLLIPFYITALCIIIWFFVKDVDNSTYDTFSWFIRRCLAQDPGGMFEVGWMPTWFLFALFWGKSFYYFLSKNKLLALPMSLIISASSVFINMQFSPAMPLSFLRGLQSLIFISIGWTVAQYSKGRLLLLQERKWIVFFLCILSVCCWIIHVTHGHYLCMFDISYDYWLLNVAAGCGGTLITYFFCVCVFNFFKRINCDWIIVFFCWLGINSLLILCMHDVELNCSFIRLLLHKFPDIEMQFGTLIRYIITLIIVFILNFFPRVRYIFHGTNHIQIYSSNN